MNDIKISKLLEQLLEDSMKIGDKKGAPLTAERFLVAIFDKLSSTEYEKAETELLALGGFVDKFLKNIHTARESLMRYITQDKDTSSADDLYMKTKLQEAFDLASKASLPEVQSVDLFMCITQDPSDVIKAVMRSGGDGFDTDSDEEQEDIISELDSQFQDLFDEIEEDYPIDDEEEFEIATAGKRRGKLNDKRSHEDVKSDISFLIHDVKRIREELKNAVYGQDNAINVFTTGYFQANMLSLIDRTRRRPRATFLFAGPPGVGKTLLAEKAAESLRLPFMRFDMSEYADKEANIEFCGSDKVYKNGKPGNVTSFVSDNPRCVLLFDEIEKAHICVIHLFLQMLDAGRLRDNYTDEEVSFTNTIIILTTNAGKQLYEDCESDDLSTVSRKVIVKALQKDVNPETGVPYFPGAICSRFASGNIVMFNHIGAHDLRSIAKKEIERHASNLEKESGIKINIDERVYTALLFSEGSNADARTIRSRSETFFNDELYELLRLVSSEKVKTSIENIDKIDIDIDLNGAIPYISELFDAEGQTKVLVFADKEIVTLCKNKASKFDFIGFRDAANAIEILKSQNIDLILMDMNCGACSNSLDNLNIEDVESPARDFFKFLKEYRKELPVYIIEKRGSILDEEEKISFYGQGVRGVLNVSDSKGFVSSLEMIAFNMHQQASMSKLARENKIISFETAQTVSKNGKNAGIKLFDFKITTAVDSEDTKNVLSSVSKPNVRFDEVIGADDAKKELKYFVDYLKNPKKYMGTGVKPPKGVILYGPPGTGKTMLAKAMACEADVTFIAAEGNQFLKKFIGEGSEKVHELFRTARKYAPSILFIDEIDAIAKERKGGANAGTNGEETLTAFLTEMDGFVNDPSKPVFVLAATNFDVEPGRDKSLDPALMRRFDRRVLIDLPNKSDRVRFLTMKVNKNQALDISDEQIENIALRSTGMSLAELDSVVEFALRSAIREGSTVVNDAILEEAFETYNGGEVKKWDVSQLERIARHEAGHALLCWLGGETPSYLTIVARGNHGGYMQRSEQEGKAIYTKDELLSRIRTSLGGRASEIVYYGKQNGISTGASGDLSSATAMAMQIVCSYGMDDDFGLAVINDQAVVNGMMSGEVRNTVNRILKEQMDEAVRLISENRDKIDSLVKELLSKNHLNAAEIKSVITKKSAHKH